VLVIVRVAIGAGVALRRRGDDRGDRPLVDGVSPASVMTGLQALRRRCVG